LKRVGDASDVTDEEWEFVLPYLLLSWEDSANREHDLRAVFNGVRYVARTGCPWRWMPNGQQLIETSQVVDHTIEV
jgi:transposase